MAEDSLVYTNLLVYSPEPSPDGLIRMEEAVIPIECHYERLDILAKLNFTKFIFKRACFYSTGSTVCPVLQSLHSGSPSCLARLL